MRKHRSNIEGLCEALDGMSFRTTIPGSTKGKCKEKQSVRSIENVRLRGLKEIARIACNAKRLTSR